jgi:hypothetical protein
MGGMCHNIDERINENKNNHINSNSESQNSPLYTNNYSINDNIELSNDIAKLKDFEIPIIREDEYKQVEKKNRRSNWF